MRRFSWNGRQKEGQIFYVLGFPWVSQLNLAPEDLPVLYLEHTEKDELKRHYEAAFKGSVYFFDDIQECQEEKFENFNVDSNIFGRT